MSSRASRLSEHQISCPACGIRQSASAVAVLHPGDPALGQLFSGDLNRITCTSCGKAFLLDVPILFRDDRHHILVYCVSTATAGSWQSAEEQMEVLSETVFAELAPEEAPSCRLVTSRGDLIEKIALLDRGLDDRLVEYVKYQLFHHPEWKDTLDPVRHHMLYDFSRQQDGDLAFLVFDRETGEAMAGTHIPMTDYKEIVESLATNSDFQEELDDMFPGYYVSVDRLL